ncbi:MAG: hypothetical protein Q4G10_03390 [Bacteroidia bacterium]|nr:hypothetical protein [Bacteroidia bacterium]
MLVLILISVAILIWGFATGFEANDAKAVETLLYWAYIMIGLALVACIIVGLIISVKNDPKCLVKYGLVLAGAAVLCLISYVLAQGNPAHGLTTEQPSAMTLKLTDALLILTGIAGAGAILSIVVGEIVMAIRNK